MEKTMKERILHRCTGALTVALAVFVLLFCWVLCTQQKAGAVDEITAGKYYVKASVKCDSTEGYAFKVYYTDQGGSEHEWHPSITEDDSWHDYYSGALSGFPTSLYMKTHGNNFDNGDIHATITVYSNSGYSENAITVCNNVHFNVARVGGSDVKGHYDITTDSGSVEENGSYKGRDGHSWPGIGISSLNATSIEKRTYKLNDSGNIINASSWTTSGVSNAIQLDGETYTEFRTTVVPRDKFGVIIGGGPSDYYMKGTVFSTASTLSTTDFNNAGLGMDNTFTTSSASFIGTIEPDAHLSEQNRNKQRVTFYVQYQYGSDTKTITHTVDVTDESYTTQFYDRTGTLRKGTASVSSPALFPAASGRIDFATSTNSSTGVQYTYYGDAVHPPFDYTGTDDVTTPTRFLPLTYGTSNTTAREAAESDQSNFHYTWKGWTPLRNDTTGQNDASQRVTNNASTYQGAKTGSAAKYQTAKESLILQECFNKIKHTPEQWRNFQVRFSGATCIKDAIYYKACSDGTCRHKFTYKGEGALGKGVDNLWTDTGTMLHHDWDKTPDGITWKEHATTKTSLTETCVTDGSHGYYYCQTCQKYFSYLKNDDSTDEMRLMVKDQYGNDTTTPMNDAEVLEDAKIPAPGHDYVFKGWTWGEGNTSATGTIECANSDICTETTNRVHSFTVYTDRAPTTPNNKTRVLDNTFRISLTTKNPTCTANGSNTFEIPADAVNVRVTSPEQTNNTFEVSTSRLRTVVTLPKLGHDYRGEYVGTGYNKKTDTYTGHQRKCVRYAACGSVGVNLTYENNDPNGVVTQTNPGGVISHSASTATSRTATCQVYAVCADCGLQFGSLAPHKFDGPIHNTDAASVESFAFEDYAGHNYACSYAGCNKYGIMQTVDGVQVAQINGTEEHTFNEGVLQRPASCTVNGQRKYTCTACGFAHTTTLEADLEATGHDYSGQPVTISAFKTGNTYNTTMTASVTCKNPNCGKYKADGTPNPTQVRSTVTETVDIVAVRHEPTCTVDGYVARTATFTDPAFADAQLNGEAFNMVQSDNSETLPALGHDWTSVTVTWASDFSTCTGVAVCGRDASHNVTQEAIVTHVVTRDPTCTEDGSAKYSAAFKDGEGHQLYYDETCIPKLAFSANDQTGVFPATGHSWGTPTYTWDGNDFDGYNSVYAYNRCSVCRETDEEEVYVTTVHTPETCEEDGSIVWTAGFTKEAFTPQTKTKILLAKGHDYNYDDATYSWTRVSGGYKCTARAICGNDSHHVDTEAVTVEGVTTPATCTTRGRTIYTAEFNNPFFSTQTKEIEIAALGHNWDTPTVEWEFDDYRNEYVSVSGTIHCLNDPDHFHSKSEELFLDDGDLVKKVRTPATCDETGLIQYKAKFSAEFGTQNITQVIPKLSHVLGTVQDGTAATCASPGFKSYRVCENCQKTFIEDPEGSDNWVEATDLVLYPSSEHKDEHGNPYPVTTVEAQPATCVAKGTRAVTYCSGCKLIFSIDGVDTYTATVDGEEVQKPLTEKNYRYGTDKAQYVLDIDPTNHVDVEEVLEIPATCVDTGILHHWHCNDCGKYYADADYTQEILRSATVLPLSGHDFDYEHATYSWAADYSTCTATAVCRNNGEHLDVETVESVETVIDPVTCEAAGRSSFHATFTNENFVAKDTGEKVITALGHDFDYLGTKYKPTYAWTSYSDCTATVYCKHDKTHVITRTGTVSSETEIAQDCDVDGRIVYTATFENNVPPTTNIQILNRIGHDWDYNGSVYDVQYIWSPDTTRCTAVVSCLHNPEHKFEVNTVAELVPIKVGTCTEGGKAMYEATFGYGISKAQSEPVITTPLGHIVERVPAVPATCLESGVYLHYHCSRCDRYFSDPDCLEERPKSAFTQDKIDHTLVTHQAIEADCTKEGSVKYWTCNYCGQYFLDAGGVELTSADAVKIPARGHNWITKAGQSPSCTEAGWEPYNYCLRCKKTEGYVSIPATGHGDFIYDYLNSATSSDGSVRWDIYACGRGCGSFHANLTVTLRDKNGKGVPNANVTISSKRTGAVYASGVTDSYGEFAPTTKFGEDNYRITVSYEDANNTYYAASEITFYTDASHAVHVISPKLGKTDFAVDGSGNSGNQNSTPSNVCKWCGEVHTGFFGKIVQFFHNILVIFSR